MEGVEARIDSNDLVVVPPATAVDAENSHVLGEPLVLAQHHPRISSASEVLRRKERQCAEISKGSGHSHFSVRGETSSPHRLCGILHKPRSPALGESTKLRHRSHAPVQMDRQEHQTTLAGRSSLESALHRRRREVEGCRIDVGEYELRPDTSYRPCGREKGERRRHDRVIGTDFERHQGEEQGVTSGGNADRVPGTAELFHLALEALHCRPENKLLRSEHRRYGVVDFGANFGVLRLEVEKRYFHRGRNTIAA